ncbi:hypothetical protein [Tropicimonas sp.]|uniref:hypothetical protein n=1 Tax=Tropicimonas sp. TaxID=2067044 RepID=UPI003A847510
MPRTHVLAAALTGACALSPAEAQPAGLALELNRADPVETGCRLTFVLHNAGGPALVDVSLLTAVFDAGGTFDRQVDFRLGGIGAGRSKVQQFDLVGIGCEDISRLMVERVSACAGETDRPADCANGLAVSSAAAISLEY